MKLSKDAARLIYDAIVNVTGDLKVEMSSPFKLTPTERREYRALIAEVRRFAASFRRETRR